MSHEPECVDGPDVDDKYLYSQCDCEGLRAAYRRGYRDGYNERGQADAQSRAMFGGWESYDPQAKDNRP